ncbi:MAG: hypothetical protein GKR97_00290 [Rhizobiaceae bacterium]|nr:hypothetical protein [Rhizobiaceae bacterium]
MEESFEQMLSGGHPNSLGRTEEVVDLVLNDEKRLAKLYQCYFSADEVVRLRVSSAFKRITAKHPQWTMQYMDGLLSEVAEIDQASTQWTLAILFEQTQALMSAAQTAKALQIMKHNLAVHHDWIVLNTTMNVLANWAKNDVDLEQWMRPHLKRLSKDSRNSVSRKAAKLIDQLGK